MLTKLLPDQISKFWDVVKYAIEESLPPVAGEGPDKMNKVLTSLLCGKSECWASHSVDGDKRRFEAVVITRIYHDDVSDTKSLLIYSLYGYSGISEDSWKQGLKALVKYATSRGCDRIIAYTEVPYLIELAKRLGGEARYTFISVPLS